VAEVVTMPVVAVAAAEADGAVAVEEEAEDVTMGGMAVVAAAAEAEVTVVGEGVTEDVTGGEWTRTIVVIRLILQNRSRFGPVL